MSELNLALQAVGMMREKLATAGLEKVLEGCNSMKNIRVAAKNHPGFQDEFTDSVQPPILLLSSLFQRLKLKDEPFSLFPSSSSSEVESFLNTIKQIEPDIQPTKCTKASELATFPKLKDFFEHCCLKRHYMFPIKKCGASDCSICKKPRLPKEVFDTISHLPDPVKNGDIYKPFSDVYGTITTEEDRPSLQSCAEKGNSGIPFNPSGQFARNVGKFVECSECSKPRVLYSARKLQCRDQQRLDFVLSDTSFSCGTVLQDFITDDIGDDHILRRVFVRKNISCNSRIETPFYSCNCFGNVCIHCGTSEDLIETPGYYPRCESCKCDSTKVAVLKRKCKLIDI